MNLSSINDNENQSILLIDSAFDFNNLKKIVNKKNIMIITFDYKSHTILENQNISHKLSEDYLTDDQYEQIQEYVYKFSYWYTNEKFSNFLQHEQINIGRLYIDEMINFLVRFLKKFREIEVIFKSNPNKKFYADNELFDITKFFTNSVKNEFPSKSNPYSFTHDEIRLDLKINKFQKSFFINKTLYLKIKRLIDNITTSIVKPKRYSDSNIGILFAEFNTERFKDLFLESTKFNAQIFFYGRRRPAFWNMSTFKTMIDSKCKIITDKNLEDQKFEKNKSTSIKIAYDKLSKLWDKTQDLEEFFTFNSHPIFKLIKPTLIHLIEKNIPYIFHEIELVKTMFHSYKFDYSVIINESGFSEQIIAALSKNFGIKCIHLQEGFHPDSKGVIQNLTSQGVFLHDAEILNVWGEIDKDLAIKFGNISTEKINIIGAPRYDDLFNSKKSLEKYVLLASSADPQPEEVEGLRIKKINKYLQNILETSKIISELDEEIIIKLHPSPTQLFDIVTLAPRLNSKISVVTKGEISSLLPSAKLLISIGLSSAMIEALILKIPVILIPGIDYNWGESSIENEKGCVISNLDAIKHDATQILQNKNFFHENESFQNYLAKLIHFEGTSSKTFYQSLFEKS
tara:strand:- start:511 stop:2391 length:1881 start_codon:yes stop_codon:yes gene_type:complete